MAGSDRSLGRGFQALFAGSLISNTGDGVRLAALPLLAAYLSSSPLVIASVTAAQYLPWVTFAPIGGALVDRWDRRRIIMATQALRGLVMAVLTVLILADAVAIWQLCVVAFVITAGEILVDPAIVALVPTVVEDEQLDTANGRISSVEILTNDFAGGPIGAAAFAWTMWVPFVVDTVSYLGSVLPFSRLPKQPMPSVPTEARSPVRKSSLGEEAREGFNWLRTHPILGPLTAANVVYFFGFSSGFSLLVVLVTQEVGASALTFGLVLAAGAIGAFIGSLAGGRLAATFGRRATLAGTVALQGVGLVALALVDSGWQQAVIWFAAGIPAGAQRPVSRTLQQRLTPNHLLGRVNISARVFTRGIIIVGALTSGLVASAVGIRWAFVLGGVIELLAAVLVLRALRGIDAKMQ